MDIKYRGTWFLIHLYIITTKQNISLQVLLIHKTL